MYDYFGPDAPDTHQMLVEVYGFDPFGLSESKVVWMYDSDEGVYYSNEPVGSKLRDLITLMYRPEVMARLAEWSDKVVKDYALDKVDPKGLFNVGTVVPRYFRSKKKDLVIDRGRNKFSASFQVPFMRSKRFKKLQASGEMTFEEFRRYVLDTIQRMKDLGFYASGIFDGVNQTASQVVTGNMPVLNTMMDLNISKDVFKETDWLKIKKRLVPADVRKPR